MAKEALNTQDTTWQHADTRITILAAARKLLADGSPDGLSLDAVGDATGFAHATIYAYFASRTDMLVSILCEDVCAFARSMEKTYPFPETTEEPEPEPAPVLPFIAPAAERAPEPEPEPKPKAEPEGAAALEAVAEPVVEEEPTLETSGPEEASSPEPVVEIVSGEGDIAELRQAIAKIQARPVDAWLERRLRVFEKTLAELQTRLTAIEGTSNRSSGVVEEHLKRFTEKADALEKRQREAGDGVAEKLEASDRKARGTVAELRAMLNDVYGRLESLEIAKGIAVTPAPPLDTQWEAGETIVPAAEKPETDKPLTAAAETYLSAARRAAKTAADLAEIERNTNFMMAAAQSWTRTRVILASCIGLGALLVIAGLYLHYATPTQHVVVPPVIAAAPVVHHVVAAKTAPPAALPAVKTPPKPDMALYRVTAAASTGNADAELLLGLRTLDGEGVAQDDAKAAQLLQQSAAQGNAVAQYWLGTLYERGRGVKTDPEAAWRWYQSAAKKGNVKAMYNLAVAAAHGKGTKPSLTTASHWFWVAAMQGYVDAQYNLAVLYERGQGVPQSLVNAYKWYAIAAAAGDHDSKASIDVLKTQLKPAELSAGERAASSYKPNAQDQAANTQPDPAQIPGG